MAKLSGPMIEMLREVAKAGPEGVAVTGRTQIALERRELIRLAHDDAERVPRFRITQDGAYALAALGDLATGRGDNGIGAAMPDPAGPSVRLTPAPADTKREATDAEVLQLLAVLDAGGSVHRALYQEWGVLDAPFRLDLDAVNRAARDAVRFGLARQAFVNREYTLTAEPIHLDAGNRHSACGFPLNGFTIRHRVTSDPSKVTHERCKR